MLQGTLNDFTLADVFSLLALTKKTGALGVTSDGTDGRVFFREGLICLALSDAKRVPLGARLVSAGLVDADQVRATVEQHTGDSVAVTEALLASGHVEDRVLAVFLREQIVDAIFELMRLEKGSFNFDAAAPALSRGVGLSVVEVVGEATRRLDEWQAIHQRISSPTAVLAMVPSAAGGREGVALAAEQWELLALIDGRRTVSDVVELTGRGEFATCRVLGDLVEGGLIQAQDRSTGEQTDLEKLIAAREALRALEQIDKPGITPRLSSAAPLAEGTSRIRWMEPPAEAAAETPARPAMMASRSRVAEAPAAESKPAAAPALAPTPTPAPAPAAAAASAPKHVAPASPPAASDGADRAAPEAARTPTLDVEQSQPPAPPPAAPVVSTPAVDRAQVARELASLGLDGDEPETHDDPSALTRDGDVNKGLLLRLIDGVKGA